MNQTDPNFKTCLRCGWVFAVNTTRKVHDRCKDCRARKATKVKDCLAWHGAFADDMVTPITDDGELVRPGRRTCGKSDCVRVDHIEK